MWMGWSLRHGFACLAIITIGATISVLLYLTTDNLSRAHPSVFRKDFVTRWIRSPWRGGHAFIYSNFEEQTNGARNLWQLEMWAELLGIEVAEPFAVDSMFGLKGATSNISQALRFSDYYDIEKWNKRLREYGASPLVKWESFLSTAPHEAIIVYTVMKPIDEPNR